jgi:hypothetical protein
MTDVTRLLENPVEATTIVQNFALFLVWYEDDVSVCVLFVGCSLCTVVKQELSVSIDFDHVVKFGEMNLHT